jgi:hypothetical protein
MSKLGDLLNHGQPERAATAAAGAPPGPPMGNSGPYGPVPKSGRPPTQPSSAPRGGGGGGHELEVERGALERAAAAAPDIEAGIRAGLRPIGPDSREAAAGIKGWATAAALDKVAAGWHTKINSIADHVADFEPKLKETARNIEQAEQNTAQMVRRLGSWS